jgi:hypothetical protein
MTFVFPLIMGGLVLAGVPILLHLIMRQKPKHLMFPAFRFLLKRHRTNLRKLRLRHLLLLALRVLLVVLACLALAQPKLYTNRRVNPRDQPVAAVLVIDTSVRMGYVLEGKPGWPDATKPLKVLDEARRRATELLNQLHKDSRVVVLDTAESKKVWMSCDDARERIKKLIVRPANAPVTRRLGEAYGLLEKLSQHRDPAQSTLPRFLFVFSDRTKPSWETAQLKRCQQDADRIPPPAEKLQAAADRVEELSEVLRPLADRLQVSLGPALVEQLHLLKEFAAGVEPEDYAGTPVSPVVVQAREKVRELVRQLRLPRQGLDDEQRDYRDKVLAALDDFLRDLKGAYEVYVDVGVPSPMNLAVEKVELPRQVVSRTEQFTVKATIRALGDTFNQRVDCLVDGQAGKIDPQPIKDLESGRSTVLSFKINCRTLKLAKGLHQLEVSVPHVDPFGVDDTGYLTFEVRDPRNMLTVADDPSRAGAWQAAVGVNGEFACAAVSVADYLKMKERELVGYQAICLFEITHPGKDLWERLSRFVKAGGGLVVVPPNDRGRQEESREAYNDNPVAQRLLPGRLGEVRADLDEGVLWDWKKGVDYGHALLKPFRPWADNPNTDFVRVPRRAYRYWQVHPGKQAHVLVRYAGRAGHAAVLETLFKRSQATGRVILLTTAMDDEQGWNNYLATDSSFAPLFPLHIMRYLAGSLSETQLNFESGQPVEVPLPRGKRALPFTVEGPDLEDAPATLNPDKGDRLLRVRGAVWPGNYPIYDNDRGGGAVARFSVNLPPGENDLTPVATEEVAALFGPGALVPVGSDANLLDALRDQWNRPLEFFRWFLILVVLFLVGESFLANKFYRREPDGQTPQPPAESPSP